MMRMVKHTTKTWWVVMLMTRSVSLLKLGMHFSTMINWRNSIVASKKTVCSVMMRWTIALKHPKETLVLSPHRLVTLTNWRNLIHQTHHQRRYTLHYQCAHSMKCLTQNHRPVSLISWSLRQITLNLVPSSHALPNHRHLEQSLHSIEADQVRNFERPWSLIGVEPSCAKMWW